MQSSLRAGAAIADVSPGPGIELAGYPHYPRHNTGIHDPLYASCLTLDDGATRLAIVGMDLVGISRQATRAIRRQAAARSGIPAENILLSCSHTHSGPWTIDFIEPGQPGGLIKPNPEYLARLEAQLADLIVTAAGHPFDAQLGIAKGRCGRESGIGGNRRDPDGPADPEVWVIGVKDQTGAWRAGLVKYALHPTVIHEDSTVVTADYPAYLRQYLARIFPGLILLFAQGTSGDQSSRYFRQGQSFAEAERIGSILGQAAAQVFQRLTLTADVRLDVRSATVKLPLRNLPARAEAEARATATRQRYEALKASGASYLEVQNANLDHLGAEDTLTFVRLRAQDTPVSLIDDERQAEVQVLAIGDSRLVALPGELFVEWGLQIQAGSPCPQTFVIELANGFLPGYVCTAEAYARGGYETGASLMTAAGGERLVQTALELLRAMAP